MQHTNNEDLGSIVAVIASVVLLLVYYYFTLPFNKSQTADFPNNQYEDRVRRGYIPSVTFNYLS
jgi:hypothetical protein